MSRSLSWLRTAFRHSASTSRPVGAPRRRPCPPTVELLEQRLAPANSPFFSMPTNLVGNQGTIVSVPVSISHLADSNHVRGLSAADLVLTYDPSVFSVSSTDVTEGNLLTGAPANGAWSLTSVASSPGLLILTASSPDSAHDITASRGGVLAQVAFHVKGSAPTGASLIHVVVPPQSAPAGSTSDATDHALGTSYFLAPANQVDGVVNVTNFTVTHFSVSALSQVTAGTSFHVTITALDRFNNIVKGYTGTVHFTSTDGVADLPADDTLQNGRDSFDVTLKTAGNQTITIADSGNNSVAGTSDPITVQADSVTHLGLTTLPTATAGSPFGVTVAALDEFNNVVLSYSGAVHFTKTDGAAGSAVPADYTFVPGDNGVHTFSNGVTLVTLGNQSVTATDTKHASVTGSATVHVIPPDPPLTAGTLSPPSPAAGVPINDADLFHFTDADPNASVGDYEATVDWGDGSGPVPVQVVADPNGLGFDVIGSHTYLAAATGLTIRVVVRDLGGAAPISASATVNVSGDVVLSGTDGNDTLTLAQGADGPGSITYVLNGAPPVELRNISSFQWQGGAGDDTMTVDFASGVPLVSGSISFDGGSGTNTLTVDAMNQRVQTPAGRLTVGGQSVSYSNVQVLNLNNAAGVNAAAGPDTQDRATAFAGLTPAERAVQALFLDALGRLGSIGELDPWVALLPAGATSLTQAVVSGIENSLEAQQNLVTSWFVNFLGRQPNGQEEQPFVNLLQGGETEEQVLRLILGSTEFYDRAQTLIASGTADERFVQALYLVLLDRAAGPTEVATVVNLLPTLGQSGVALILLQSAEFRAIQFEGYYNALLHRPSGPADAAFLNSLLNSSIDIRSARFLFESSSEFYFNG